jgi:hypothetical protein
VPQDLKGEGPWERLPGEPPRAYNAFATYRDLPPGRRSLDEVARRLYGGGSRKRAAPGRVRAWSVTWDWVRRAARWDAEVDRQGREAAVAAVRAMNERHAAEARMFQEKALQRLRDLDPARLSPAETLRYFEVATRLERVAMGAPEQIERVQHAGPDNGPAPPAVVHPAFRPTPEFLAEVMAILARHDPEGTLQAEEQGPSPGAPEDD